MSKEVDLGQCFKEGWELYKANFAILVLSTLIAGLVGVLTCGILYAPLTIGVLWIIDRIRKGDPQKPAAGDVFKGMSKFGPSFLCFIIFMIIFSIASAVPIIGQIASFVASPLIMFALMYIAFEDLDAIEAIKRVCNELFSGKLLMPVVIGILAGLASSVGALACGVGVFLTLPLAPAIYVCTYYQMKEKNEDILDAEVVAMDDSPTGDTRPETTPEEPRQTPE
jgi:hypothetical protein